MENTGLPVIISGSSSGIGEAASLAFLNAGYKVIGCDKAQPGNAIDDDNFEFHEIDFSDVNSLAGEFSKVLNTIEGPIRAVINNAGLGRMGFLEQLSIADLQTVMNTNFLSHVIVSKTVVPRLKKQAEIADIIFTGSEAALNGARQGSIYCASKFAIRGFSQALREECAKSGVRVMLVNPGAVRTPFFDDLHFEPGPAPENAIEPEDIAQAMLSGVNMREGSVIEEINISPMTHVWQRK